MNKTIRDCLLITIASTILTIAIWIPHFFSLKNFYGLDFSKGMSSIYQNYDGLEYIIIAKSYYSPGELAKVPQEKPPEYYPSHFPGYSFFISLFAPIFGYLKSMLLVTQIFTVLSILAFYFLVKDFKLTSNPLVLSLIFIVLPARWIIVHSVGSSEPTFIFFTILAVYFFLKFQQSQNLINMILPSLFASAALLTRPPGTLLPLAFGLFALYSGWKNTKTYINYLPLGLTVLTLGGIFYLFQVQLNDFWAYFHSGDNIHLTFPPFQVFNISQYWVGDFWLEDIIYIFILGFLAAFYLLKNKVTQPIGFYVLIFMLAGVSIAHRDISRYLLPISPFVLIAFEKVLVSKEFRIIALILLVGFYMYSQNYILNNTAPVSDLTLLD